MSKTRFYMVVGLPGSGKTYWAYNQARPYDVVLDSDEIRAEEYGDASCQDAPDRIFNIMFQRTRAALRASRDVYYVATNLSSRRRLNLVKSLKKMFPNIHYYCVVMATPIDVCYERNGARERVVPAYVIDRMLRQFEMPCEGEGWDKILVQYDYAPKYDMDYYRRSYARLVEEYGEQGNSHHALTLQEHCRACGDIAMLGLSNANIVRAAYIHDYGKVWTAIRWEKDDYRELHYPNHANVSCYMALTMGYNAHVAQLVAYHMIPYTDQKCQDTWRSRMGEKLWKEVVELHQYDEAAK